MLISWFHRLFKHEQQDKRVSVPLFDVSARGILRRCSCGKVWAL